MLYSAQALDSRLRGNDGGWVAFLKLITLGYLVVIVVFVIVVKN
jgi:hypothetical protein